MKRTPFVFAVLILATAALVACATPRERSERQWQPEPVVEHQPASVADEQQRSELADLTGGARRAAPTITTADSFDMAGSGDASEVHELAAGLYQCSIDLQGERPAPFRIQFVSREPLNPSLVDTTQSVWMTSFELVLPGNAQIASSGVEVRLHAAPASEWTLRCERRADFARSDRASRSAIQLTLTLNDEPRGNIASSSGRGPGIAMISGIPDVYTCQISVSGNFADDGSDRQFAVKLGDLTLVDVSTTTWSGEVEYELADRGASAARPTLSISAGESASWNIVCSPKTS